MPTKDFARQVETTLQAIQASDEIHPDNKAAIKNFQRDLALQEMSDGWQQKLLAHLKLLAIEAGPEQRFEDMDKDDVKDLVAWVQQRDVSDSTVNAYKQVIKRFWRWQADLPKGEHPEATEWVNTTSHSGQDKLPQNLLSRDDIDALKDACRNPRDRAFVAMLYETGARIGELIDLTVGEIEDTQRGLMVVIDGKTGQRRLPLLESVPAINKWLNDHPDPQSDVPLWCKLQDASEGLSYNYLRKSLLQRAADRADLEKPVNPHHFRHSRASHLANEFTEAQLCEWFGWVQGSDVPAKYVHLSGRDIDDAYARLHGLEPVDEEEDRDPIDECWRCGELNESEDRFCGRCGAPLDEDAAGSLEEQMESKVKESYKLADPKDTETMEKLDTLDEILDDPEVKTALLAKLGND